MTSEINIDGVSTTDTSSTTNFPERQRVNRAFKRRLKKMVKRDDYTRRMSRAFGNGDRYDIVRKLTAEREEQHQSLVEKYTHPTYRDPQARKAARLERISGKAGAAGTD